VTEREALAEPRSSDPGRGGKGRKGGRASETATFLLLGYKRLSRYLSRKRKKKRITPCYPLCGSIIHRKKEEFNNQVPYVLDRVEAAT